MCVCVCVCVCMWYPCSGYRTLLHERYYSSLSLAGRPMNVQVVTSGAEMQSSDSPRGNVRQRVGTRPAR